MHSLLKEKPQFPTLRGRQNRLAAKFHPWARFERVRRAAATDRTTRERVPDDGARRSPREDTRRALGASDYACA